MSIEKNIKSAQRYYQLHIPDYLLEGDRSIYQEWTFYHIFKYSFKNKIFFLEKIQRLIKVAGF